MKLFSAPDKVAIFVSYRRADSAGYAGRLVDKLKAQFGNQVFFDVDSIRPGANFHDVIRETLDKCGDGASMPAEAVLPAPFQEISSLNAMELRHTSFDRDVQAVSDHLADILGGAKATSIERALLKLYGPPAISCRSRAPQRREPERWSFFAPMCSTVESCFFPLWVRYGPYWNWRPPRSR